jgi:hypothetical protein
MRKPSWMNTVRADRIITFGAIGLVFVVAAFLVRDSWRDAGVWQSLLVEAGVAIGLIGFITVASPMFFRRVEEAARQGAEEGEASAERRLGSRIDELQEKIDQELRLLDDRQDQAVQDLEEAVSAESIAKVLHDANGIRAIANGKLTVPAGPGPRHLRMEFAWGSEYVQDPVHAYSGESTPIPPPELKLSIEGVSVIWHFDDPLETIATKLVRLMQRNDDWPGEGRLDFAFAMRNLQQTIKIAIDSRRRIPGSIDLKGSISELFDVGVFITDQGVEVPSRHYFISTDDIENSKRNPANDSRAVKWECPEFMSPEDFKFLRAVTPEPEIELYGGSEGMDWRDFSQWIPWGGIPEEQPFPE